MSVATLVPPPADDEAIDGVAPPKIPPTALALVGFGALATVLWAIILFWALSKLLGVV